MNDKSHHIGQYRILRKIGEGGMGMVFVGEHILLKRRAAIKTLLPALSAQREIVERFFNEARATSAITDPGVVQIFDFGYHVDGTAYIVMELLEGESLGARIDRLGQLAISDSLRIARQVAGSLAIAHARNIVHRDLKPENLFLIADSEAQGGERTKILDFGICKLGGDGNTSHTASGVTFGTPVYMSPEQCRGSGTVDHRADIYGLGCVLFHMLTSRTPFECNGAGEFVVAHMQQDPPAPSELVPALPPMIDALVLRCLAKAPDSRFQSMEELQVAIEQVLARISAPESRAVVTNATVPLGSGFRSGYDRHGAATSEVPKASRVPAQLVITATPITLDPSYSLRSSSWQRAALALLFVTGGVVATLMAMYAGDQAVALAEPLAAAAIGTSSEPANDLPVDPVEKTVKKPTVEAPAVDTTAIAPSHAVEPDLATPAADIPAIAPSHVVEPNMATPAAPAVTTVVRDPAGTDPAKTNVITKPAKPSRPAIARPRPRTMAHPAKPTAEDVDVVEDRAAEDLYDTR